MISVQAICVKSIARAILSVALITGLISVLPLHSPISAAVALPNCVDSQLVVTGVEVPGGSLHAGLLIRYRNASTSACSLTGYADVVGINFETGKSRAAGHIRNGYLGGWMGIENGKAKALPRVLLRARDGEASSMVEWADGGTAQQPGCAVLNSLWVDLPGGSRPNAVKEWMLVCGYFDTTPFVAGVTGSAH